MTNRDPEATGRPRAWTHLWALAPLATMGLVTPAIIGYAAFRLRSVGNGIAALGYLAAVVLVATTPEGSAPAALEALTAIGLFTSWFGGTAHAYLLRSNVFSPHPHTRNHQAILETFGPLSR